jgi:coenzyme F420-0:L-glutamate ligase/coenzyme F420-1:gamma-L-glutamate ligase
VTPSPQAEQWAATYGKDARVVEVILRESRRIVRMERGVIIAETHHGFVCANAGVDTSNVPTGFVTLLPHDPDASAARLRGALSERFGRAVGVIVSDSFGRPWREGVVNVALGVAGLRPLADYRGCHDGFGRRLESTVMAVADELASAAELVMRKTTGTPVAIVRGAAEWSGEGSGQMLVRDQSRDLFR